MNLFKIFKKKPDNPFAALVSRKEYDSFGPQYLIMSESHQQAIILFIQSGMKARAAFEAYWAILLTPDVGDHNFQEAVQETANAYSASYGI